MWNEKKLCKIIMLQDSVSGKTNQTFRTPYTTQHKIGGAVPVRTF